MEVHPLLSALADLVHDAYQGRERLSGAELRQRAGSARLAPVAMARVDALPDGEYTEEEAARALLGAPEEPRGHPHIHRI